MGIMHAATVLDTEQLLLAGLSGITVHDTGSGLVVRALSAGEGAVLRFALDPVTGALAFLDQTPLARAGAHGLVDLGGGDALLLDRYGDTVLVAAGAGVVASPLPLPASLETAAHLALDGGGRLLAWVEPGRAGVQVAELSATGAVIATATLADDAERPLGDVRALDLSRTADGQIALVAGGGRDSGLALFTGADMATLAERQILAPEGDFAHYQISTLARLETPAGAFLVAGASASGTLSLFAVDADGTLTLTDHLFDGRDTRFGGVDHVAFAMVEGRALLAAGGADRGVTLFEMDGAGQLHLLDVLIDDAVTALDDVEGLELVGGDVPGQALLVAAGARDGGISTFTLDLAALQPAGPVTPFEAAAPEEVHWATAAPADPAGTAPAMAAPMPRHSGEGPRAPAPDAPLPDPAPGAGDFTLFHVDLGAFALPDVAALLDGFEFVPAPPPPLSESLVVLDPMDPMAGTTSPTAPETAPVGESLSPASWEMQEADTFDLL